MASKTTRFVPISGLQSVVKNGQEKAQRKVRFLGNLADLVFRPRRIPVKRSGTVELRSLPQKGDRIG